MTTPQTGGENWSRKRAEEIVGRHVSLAHPSSGLTNAIEQALAIKAGHIRDERGRDFNLWSVIRSGLSDCREEISQVAQAQEYEVESAHLDAMARKLASYVSGDIREQIEAAEAKINSKGPKHE